jgi:histidine triad (HIT) family protein
MDCIFCKIINREIPATIIAENDYALAFRDIYPKAPTHILIIPKLHISSTVDLDETNINYVSEMMLLANQISVNENLNKNGYRWVINTGKDGGQTVFHIHLHLLGGRSLQWPPG